MLIQKNKTDVIRPKSKKICGNLLALRHSRLLGTIPLGRNLWIRNVSRVVVNCKHIYQL